MGRTLVRLNVLVPGSGADLLAVQNAAVSIYRQGTTDLPVMYANVTGGSAISNPRLSDDVGEVAVWLDPSEQPIVDAMVDANSAQAYLVQNPSRRVAFSPYTKTIRGSSDGVPGPPGPGGSDPNAVKLTGDQTVSGKKSGKWLDAGGQVFNPLAAQFGAIGDGIANDTAAVQAAQDAAAAVGGTVSITGRHKVTTINWGDNVSFIGAGRKIVSGNDGPALIGTSGSPILVFPAAGGHNNFHLENLTLDGGSVGILRPESGVTGVDYTTHVVVRGVTIKNQEIAGVLAGGHIEEWRFDDVQIICGAGSTAGFWKSNTGGHLFDKCTFKDVLINCNGFAKNGWRIEGSISSHGNETFINPIVYGSLEHAVLVDCAPIQWTVVNWNSESCGSSGKSARTTGTIVASSTSLTVASATGFAVGDPITVAGAGVSGWDLTTTISAISGTTFTLAASASKAVTSRPVTNASWDEWSFQTAISGSFGQHITFIGGSFAGEGASGHLRYGIDASGVAYSMPIIGAETIRNSLLPVYDPNQIMNVLGGWVQVRRPNLYTSMKAHGSTFAGAETSETFATVVASPPGRDLVQYLRDSTDNNTGSIGEWMIRNADPNRTRILGVATNGALRLNNAVNGCVGGITLVGGTATVSNTSITGTSRIFLSRATQGAAPGHLSYVLNVGVGFTINSSSSTDTGVISYLINELA